MPEISLPDYLNRLHEVDKNNVNWLRDSVGGALIHSCIPHILIGVGSVVSGKESGLQNYNSAGPQDIDLKLILARQEDAQGMYSVLEDWMKLEHPGYRIEGDARVIRYTHHDKTQEEHRQFAYDGGFHIYPQEGRTIDLIVKNPAYLLAKDHLAAEREKGNDFALIYTDI